MKKQLLVLFILSAFSFSFLSCEENTPEESNEQTANPLTETNYVYEGDLRIYYLQTENIRLENNITVWEQVSPNDPGYDEAQDNINEANAEIEDNESEIASIPSPSTAFQLINPRIPPIPPSPSPCLCLDLFNSIRNIVYMPGTDNLLISIQDYEDESYLVPVNTDPNVNSIPNTQNTGHFQTLDFESTNFTGHALLTIQSDSESYTIDVNFVNLP
ncbi:hypothetical protein ACW5R3_04765 [Bizionia sp. KMM 8389]